MEALLRGPTKSANKFNSFPPSFQRPVIERDAMAGPESTLDLQTDAGAMSSKVSRNSRARGAMNTGARGPTKSVNEFDTFPPSFKPAVMMNRGGRPGGRQMTGPTKSIVNLEGANSGSRETACLQLLLSFLLAVHRPIIQSTTSSKEILFSEHPKSSFPTIPPSSLSLLSSASNPSSNSSFRSTTGGETGARVIIGRG
jgi:hypothetical protein